MIAAVRDRLPNEVVDDLEEMINLVKRIVTEVESDASERGRAVFNALNAGLFARFDHLQDLLTEGRLTALVGWRRALSESLESILEDARSAGSRIAPTVRASDEDEVMFTLFNRDAVQAVGNAISEYRRTQELNEAIRSARSAAANIDLSAARANESAALAAAAAGTSGASGLAQHFGEYADRELRTANRFRFATLVALGLAAAYALFFPYEARDVPRIISHVVQVAALAGVGTFLGAQGAGHRRNGDWSRALEVQLKSFEAFIDPVRSTTAFETLYAKFGERVLGAPPFRSRARDAGELKAVTDLASAALRR